MPTHSVEALAQLVVDRLNGYEDYGETLGELCIAFVESRKPAILQHHPSPRLYSEMLFDHERAISYFWERTAKMLKHFTPNDGKHLLSLLHQSLYYCRTDIYRSEDKNKPGRSTSSRHSQARANVMLQSGSVTVRLGEGQDQEAVPLLNLLADIGANDLEAIDAKEEIDRIVHLTEAATGSLARHRGLFAEVIWAGSVGITMAELGLQHGLTESRVSQIASVCLHRLVWVLQQRYPAMKDIPRHILFARIHAAINQLKPTKRRSLTGDVYALTVSPPTG